MLVMKKVILKTSTIEFDMLIQTFIRTKIIIAAKATVVTVITVQAATTVVLRAWRSLHMAATSALWAI